MTVVDQDGRTLTWWAHCVRYGSDDWQEGMSLDDAVELLWAGEESGNHSGCCVVTPDGKRREYGSGDWQEWSLGDPQPAADHAPPKELRRP